MGFNPSPESDDVARKTRSPLDLSGFHFSLTRPDYQENDVKKSGQARQSELSLPALPLLEVHESDARSRLAIELQMLYGDLTQPAKKQADKAASPAFRPDAVQEKVNAEGTRISCDSNHNPACFTRKDGSSFAQTDRNTIVESHPGASPVTWTNLGGLWSADSGARPRTNMTLNDSGAVTFADANNIKHTIDSRGQETMEGAGACRIVPDSQNRPAQVETTDGSKIRKYDYFDSTSNDIKSVTIVDKTNDTTSVYTRSGKDSNQWLSDRGSVFTGEIRVSANGVHSIRAAENSQSDSDRLSSRWISYYPDGRETSDSINADGSRVSYDKQNNLVNFQGSDGLRIEHMIVGDKDTIRYYDPQTSKNVTWTRGNDSTWSADSARFPEKRQDLSINSTGELKYTGARGGQVEESRDGARQVTEKDGSKLDFDSNNQVIKVTKGNMERTFIRDADGIAAVKDRNLTSKEEKTVFERRPAGEENRSNVFVSSSGDLSYQNPDGTAVIERANRLHLELDRDGDITRVVNDRGTRTFQYLGDANHKAVVSVVDIKNSQKGPNQVESWTRVANPDGSLGREFRSADEKGRERKPRYNLTPCADGEYEYSLATDKAGEKAHVEKLSVASTSDMPASIEEARGELTSLFEGVMDKARLNMNVGFMKKFEQRMMDQSELQIAAGIDPDKVMRETQRCIVDTYTNCARLAGTPKAPNEMYGLHDRVRLAENLLYLANDPSDIKQGGQGTCWWESSWNVGLFQRNAGDAARFCADIALTKQYTSTAGALRGGPPKTLHVPPQYVSLNGYDSGRGWTPMNAHSSSQRSMVGMLIDQCGPPLGGQRGWGQSNAGWHTEARNILYMMTGRDNIRHGGGGIGAHEKSELLKTGGWTCSSSNHMWAYTMHKDKSGQWEVIRDDQYEGGDHVIQKIPDLKSWISNGTRSEVQRNWKAHPRRAGDSDFTPVPRPTPSPNPNYRTRPQDNTDDAGLRLSLLQMPRPVWHMEGRC